MKKHFLKSFALLAMLFSALTMSAGMELFNPATATLNKYYFAPNWVEDGISSASYNPATGTVSVDIQSQLLGQWQGQVKLQHDIDFTIGKKYQFSAKFHASTTVNNVTVKMDDATDPAIVYVTDITLPANEDFVYTASGTCSNANNHILVFDFGLAAPCQITISEISIQEVEEQIGGEDNKWDDIDWVSGSDNKYKIYSDCLSNKGNVEAPAWANNVKGIYVSVPSGISSVSLEGAVIEGAGVLLPLSSFVYKETEVTIVHAQGECTFIVYYEDGLDWNSIDWVLGSDNKYKIYSDCLSNKGNVEAPAWANNVKGIYVSVPSGISSVSLEGAVIEGAGVLLPLSSFVYKETEVTIVHAQGECTFIVYYEDGIIGGGEPETPDTEVPTLENVELFGAAQDFVLLTPMATDNQAVTAYLITPNGGAETEATLDDAGKIKISGLTMNTSYTYSVKAKDAAGNVSDAKKITFSTLDNVFCEEEVLPTAQFTKNQKLILTARKLNDTQTLFEITSSTSTLTGVQNANIENAGGGGFSGDPKMTTWSLDNNTLSKTVTWATYPTSPITMFVTAKRQPGAGENNMIEFRYTIDVSQNCGIVSTDTEAPTNLIVTVDSYDHKSIVLAVSADDNEGVTSYKVVDTDNGIEEIMTPTDGKITLSNLSSGTTYNLTVTALDAVLNESAAVTVAVTTTLIQYCDYPTGHLNIADFGDFEGRCLLTLTKINDTKVRVIVKPNYAAGATRKLDYLKAISNGITAEIGSQVTEGGYDELCVDITYASAPAQYSFIIEWSGVNDNGTMWKVTPEKVSANNWCPLTEDLEKPEMLSASLVAGSETYNSVILAVSAKDNEEVANYRVVDNTYNYDEQFAPVDGKITLTGLTPAITYNFTVTAIDLSENESDNSITVSATTTNLEYCEWLTGHLGNANWGDPNGRCLLTISKVTEKQLLVVVKPVSGANKLDFLQVQADGAPHQTVTSPAADELSIVLDFANTVTEIPLFRILWSNEGVDANWMTDLKNVKASYLCPHIELGESVDLSKLDLSAGVTTDVKITRKFVKGSGKWNTLSLPFGLDAEDIVTAFGAAKVVELSGATLVTSTDIDLSVSDASEIVAGKPYLIQIPASYAPAVIENITLSNTVTAQETATANGLAKMVSVLTPIEFNEEAGGIRFFLNTNGKLSYRSTTNGIMNPYRAYFEFPHINDPVTASQVRARVVFNENTETGVDNLITTDAPAKVIENGQLIIIRGGVKYNIQGQKL